MARHERGLRFQPTGGSKAAQIPTGKKQRLSIERLANDGRGIAFSKAKPGSSSAPSPVKKSRRGCSVPTAKWSKRAPSACLRPVNCVARLPVSTPAVAVAAACNTCPCRTACPETAHARRAAVEGCRVAPDEWAAPLTGAEFGYRRRARIAVRWDMKAKQLEVGFRAAGSQDIVGINECPVLVQPLQPIMTRLPEMLRRLSKPQALGHVELFSGSSLAVLLRHMAPLSEADLTILKEFCQFHDAQLWLHGDGEPQPVDATQSLGYRLEQWDLDLAWRPGDFIQVNAGSTRRWWRRHWTG